MVAASANRRMCGIWVADHIVICSPVGSTTTRARLHEGRDQPLLAVLPLDHDAVAAGLLDRLVDVAAGAGLAGVEHPERATCWCRGRGARAPRRAAASLRSSDGRQLVVLDVDQLGGVARLGGACGRRRTATISPAKATRSTGIGGCVGATWSGVIGQALMHDALLVGEVGAGEHVDHVGRGLGRRGVDAGDRRVRERAAHHRQVQHPGQRDVVGPAGAAGDQPLVLLAAPVAADLGRPGRSWVAVMPAPPRSRWPAACCTAWTMLW